MVKRYQTRLRYFRLSSIRVSVLSIEIIIIFVDDLSISPREAWHPLLFERLADGREKHNFMQAGCQWT